AVSAREQSPCWTRAPLAVLLFATCRHHLDSKFSTTKPDTGGAAGLVAGAGALVDGAGFALGADDALGFAAPVPAPADGTRDPAAGGGEATAGGEAAADADDPGEPGVVPDGDAAPGEVSPARDTGLIPVTVRGPAFMAAAS